LVLFCGLLLGPRAALVAGALYALSFAAVGWAVASGTISLLPGQALDPLQWENWVRTGLMATTATVMTGVGVAHVVRTIEGALAAKVAVLEQLRQEHLQRTEAEAALGRAQEVLERAGKLEAVGLLAGGVAHDFNNTLAVILGWAELVQSDPRDSAQVQAGAAAILRAAREGGELTRRLLSLSRRDIGAPRVVDLRAFLEGQLPALRRVLPDDVLVEVRYADAPHVFVDESQLQQALLNLVINARDAMERGGRIDLGVGSVELDAATAASYGLRPGRYTQLRVRDTGKGMDAATRARLFEPFFTTKPPGRGTGLGLFSVYGVVRSALGHVTVESEPGQGTEFTLLLPGTEAALEAASGPAPWACNTLGGGTVLVAEDDAQVRRIMTETLRRAGAQVLEAEDVRAAITRSREHPGAIDLLCADGIMPGLPTRALLDEIRSTRPNCSILICSGHVNEELLRRDLTTGAYEFLHKPFSAADLVARARRAMEMKPA
ncbi:MAG: ATP-binding protein, partial [Myxococcota bacterium]